VAGVVVTSCVRCGAPMWWATTVGNKRIPLDVDPHPDGNVVPVLVDGRKRVKVLTGPEMPAQQRAWRSHFATCPYASELRKTPTRPKKPTCLACHGVLDPWLVEQGEAYHVNCRPLSRAEIRAVRDAVAQSSPAGGGDWEGTPSAGEHQLTLMASCAGCGARCCDEHGTEREMTCPACGVIRHRDDCPVIGDARGAP